MATKRGEDLKKAKEAENWGSDPDDLFSNFDLPYAFIWKLNKKTIGRGIEIEVADCPLAETWDLPKSVKISYILGSKWKPGLKHPDCTLKD
jgi:hypothetical protein